MGFLQKRSIIVSAGYEDYTIKIWDAERLALVYMIDLSPIMKGQEDLVTGLALGKVEETPVIISIGVGGTLRFWDLASGSLLREICTEPQAWSSKDVNWLTAMTVVEFDGQPVIVVGSRFGTVRVYNLADGALRAVVDTGSFIFFDGLAISPPNRIVVAGSRGLTVLQFAIS